MFRSIISTAIMAGILTWNISEQKNLHTPKRLCFLYHILSKPHVFHAAIQVAGRCSAQLQASSDNLKQRENKVSGGPMLFQPFAPKLNSYAVLQRNSWVVQFTSIHLAVHFWSCLLNGSVLSVGNFH